MRKELTFKIWHGWEDEDKYYTREEFIKELKKEAKALRKLEKEARD